MTGACVDAAKMPGQAIAAAALRNRARSFFQSSQDGLPGAWAHRDTMRALAEKILERRACELNAGELAGMRVALNAHAPCADVEFLRSLAFCERGQQVSREARPSEP